MKSNLDDLRVDEAIETYPLEPLPAGFVEGVLERIEATPRFDPNSIWDANSRFVFQFIPVAILWLAFTAAVLVRYVPAWMDPAQAGYFSAMVDYWKLKFVYASEALRPFGTPALVFLVVGMFAVLWRVTDPDRPFEL